MTIFGHVYVIDNNALSRIGRDCRACEFFKRNSRIPSEVLHEASGFPDIADLELLEYPTTAGVLEQLIVVMASIPVGETKLVDLYANQGNADPLVIAVALDGQSRDAGTLFSPSWTVVSGDKAVQAKAREFGLEVTTNEEFIAVLEGRGPPPAGEFEGSG